MASAAKVLHLVLLGKKHFPLQQIDGHVHFRKREIGAAFLGEGRARMHEHEGDGVGIDGPKPRAQQRDAIAIGPFDGLHFFSGNFGGENARTWGQRHFQKRLRLIFDREFYFRERPALRGYQRG